MSQTPPTIPPSQPAAPAPAAPQPAKGGTGLAVAALVLGICGFIPCLGVVLGLIGIILGIVALTRNRPGQGLAIGGIAAGAVAIIAGQALLVSILLPSLGRARELTKRSVCRANLSSIGRSLEVYTTRFGDYPPPALEYLVEADLAAPKQLSCPSVGEGRAGGYFYFAPQNLEEVRSPGDTIVVCDLKSNHGGQGRCVLFQDGHTAFLKEEEFQSLLARPNNAAFAAALRKVEGP